MLPPVCTTAGLSAVGIIRIIIPTTTDLSAVVWYACTFLSRMVQDIVQGIVWVVWVALGSVWDGTGHSTGHRMGSMGSTR